MAFVLRPFLILSLLVLGAILSAEGSPHRSARMHLGTSVGTGECAHIGRNCIMQRNQAENPSSFTYVPCCQHLTCQGIGPVEMRNGLGQAIKSDENTFAGICTVSLDNGGGDIAQYKEYIGGL